MKRKILSILLCFSMIAAVLPTMAFAAVTGDTYYLTGSIAGWSLNEDYKFTMVEEGLYKCEGVALTTADELKAVKSNSEGDSISDWYPDGMGNDIKVSEDGTYTVYFRPDGGTEEDGFAGDRNYLKFAKEEQPSIDSIYAVGSGMGNFLNNISWNTAAEENKMSEVSENIWEITYENVDADDGYQVKFAAEGSWTNNWGADDDFDGKTDGTTYNAKYSSSDNITFNVPEDGSTVKLLLDLSGFSFATKLGAKFSVLVTVPTFYYDGDLGAIYSPEATTFRFYAPEAHTLTLSVDTDTRGFYGYMEKLMDGDTWTGVWTVTLEGDWNGASYYYIINEFEADVRKVLDPYAPVLTQYSTYTEAIVVDLDSTDPTGWGSDVHHFKDVEDVYGKIKKLGVWYEYAYADALSEAGTDTVILPVSGSPNISYGYNAANAVKEFKSQVKTLHDYGITVLASLDFSDTDFEGEMYDKYISDISTYWVNEYHVDGIVLTNDISESTKETVRAKLGEIDPRIFFGTEEEIPVVSSTAYNLWIGGVQVTSVNKDDVLGDGTVSYDADENVLILNNANITAESNTKNAAIYADGDLVVWLTKGSENHVTYASAAEGSGIYVHGELIVVGRGSLNAECTSGSSMYGVYTVRELGVFDGAKLTGRAAMDGTASGGVYKGVYSGRNIYVSGRGSRLIGEIGEINSPGSACHGVEADGDISIHDDGAFEAICANEYISSPVVCATPNGVSVEGEKGSEAADVEGYNITYKVMNGRESAYGDSYNTDHLDYLYDLKVASVDFLTLTLDTDINSMAVIFAEYDEDGVLMHIEAHENLSASANTELRVDKISPPEGYEMKIMIWDSVKGMRPYTEVIKVGGYKPEEPKVE